MDGLVDPKMSLEEKIAILQKALVTNVLRSQQLREELSALEEDRDDLASAIDELVEEQERGIAQQEKKSA